MGLEHYTRQLTPKREPQVSREMFGVPLLILYFKFQFSKSIKSSKFHIFLNLFYSLRIKFYFQKCPKNTRKLPQNPKTLVDKITRGIWRSLKSERDIGRKAMLSDVKAAFRLTVQLQEQSQTR